VTYHLNKRPAFTAITLLVLQLSSSVLNAQVPDAVRSDFRQWATQSLHAVTVDGLDAPTRDLGPLKKMIGDARVVAVSEATHAGAEALAFRNRLFKYLVEEQGFAAIAIESGIVESRLINDYVTQGKGDLDTVAKQGLTWTFDTFPQNKALIRWVRDYNSRLPAGVRKVQFLGFDVSGSPGNPGANRGPGTALFAAFDYLRTVDPQQAERLQSRAAALLANPQMTYEGLKDAERESITLAIADLVSLMERKRFQYIAKSSAIDYAWGERTSVAARQVDTWWRHMPSNWRQADGYEWVRDATQYRERAMADNLEWIVGRLNARDRVLVFAAVAHIASEPFRFPDAPERDMFGFGAYVKARYGDEFVNMLQVVAGGEITRCDVSERKPILLKLAPEPSSESLFASVNAPLYVLDLRAAPRSVSSWLSQPHEHWNGFSSMKFSIAAAFDIVFFTSSVSPACAGK
jgi:erythromycin esterase